MAGTQVATSAILRQDLAGAVVGYNWVGEGFVGHKILPPFPVGMRSGEFSKSPSTNYLKRTDTARRPGTPASRSTDSLTRDTWDIQEYAHERTFDPSNTDAYRDQQTAEQAKAVGAALVCLRDYERDVASAIYNETTFPASGNTGLTVGTPWSTAATATPIQDVMAGHNAHKLRHGKPGNVLLMNDVVWRNLSQCAQIIDRIKNVSLAVTDGILTDPVLCGIFQVQAIMVAGSVYNSADEGQTGSNSRAWSNTYAFLGRISSSLLDIEETPQLGRTMKLDMDPESPGVMASRTEDFEGSEVIVEEYAEPQTSCKVIRAKFFRQAKIINSDCGFLFKTVT